MTPARFFDEQFVLATLIDAPRVHAWELSELTPDLFEDRQHRAVAAGLCRVRDSGRRVHWRRVGVAAGPKGSVPRLLTRALRIRAGAEFGLTAAISRLHLAARRSA